MNLIGEELKLKLALKLTRKFWSGNITLSENKIVSFTEYIDNWDTWGKDTVNYKTLIFHFLQI